LVALYVTSSEAATGKTAVCAGLGKQLLSDGKKVGFFKPRIAETGAVEGVDGDTVFIKRIFALAEPVDSLCPVISERGNLPDRVKEAYARVSRGKDLVIVEGDGLDEASHAVAEALDAKVIIVEGYPGQSLKAMVDGYKDFGENLLGVILNKVPGNRLEQVREEISTQFGSGGMNILGVLPENRALLTLAVGELAQHIQGEILNNAEKSGELVENLMLGAKSADPGPEYFSRRINKAVVLRSERPDMQLAALETPTKCLVLSGDTPLIPSVLYGAEVANVPIISTKADIISILTSIEDALASIKFSQEAKLPRLAEIMEQYFNFQALYKGLGLAG